MNEGQKLCHGTGIKYHDANECLLVKLPNDGGNYYNRLRNLVNLVGGD
jgi:hypothetical protein